MRDSRRLSRAVLATALALWALALAPELQAAAVGALAKNAGRWCLAQIPAFLAGKALDLATGQDFHQQLEKEMPGLVARISAAVGPARELLQEQLEVHREQIAILERLTGGQKQELAGLEADQQGLLRRIEGLDSRMAALERRVGRLDARFDRIDARVDKLGSRVGVIESRVDELGAQVGELDYRLGQVEDALIGDCLDLRSAPVLGAGGYRIKQSPGGWIADGFDSDPLTLDVRLLLDSCSADLTRRGLVVQLSMVTRDLGRDLTLYATWKGVGSGGYHPPRLLDRQEIPLRRPSYRVDGQVVELFLPYDEIPGLGSTERTALALVLTHDGTVLYTLPDRVMSCAFGQRVQCRWVYVQ